MQALRMLRRPLAALCIALLCANLWVPVAGFAATAPYLCHGTGQGVSDDGAAPSAQPQPCCFSAVMAALPDAAPALPTPRPARLSASQRRLAALVGPAPRKAFPIRAPPFS